MMTGPRVPRLLPAALAVLCMAGAEAGIITPPVTVPMPIRDPCRGFGDSWSQHCRRDANGNLVDTRTGDVYDPQGRLIRRGSAAAPQAVPPRCSGATPNGAAGVNDQGIGLQRAGRHDFALECYRLALRLDPGMLTAYVNQGLIFYERGQVDDALRSWNEASARLRRLPAEHVPTQSTRAESLLAIASAVHARGDAARGRELAREALRIDKRMADTEHLRKQLWGERLRADAQALLRKLQ
jgi:tetratricopeptide (TPR) repeat protein